MALIMPINELYIFPSQKRRKLFWKIAAARDGIVCITVYFLKILMSYFQP